MAVSPTLRRGERGEKGTHLGMNAQVLPGAQSQPQKRQLLTLLLLIEMEQLSKLFDHLFPWRREGGLRHKSLPSLAPPLPQLLKHLPATGASQTPPSYRSNHQRDQQVLQNLALAGDWPWLTFSISGTVLEQ